MPSGAQQERRPINRLPLFNSPPQAIKSPLAWHPPPADMAHPEPNSLAGTPSGEAPLGPLLISVDDVGQFLALMPKRLVLGHSSDGQADLPFLANVGARHAELMRRDSLRSGTVWWVRPLNGERVLINGTAIQDPQPLLAGDLVRLSENLALVFSTPDPASQSALFEVQGAQECLGAQKVVLFAEGAGGILRIGAGAQRMIRVPNLGPQLSLERSKHGLWARCSDPQLFVNGQPSGAEVLLELPLERLQQLAIGQSQGGRPPFCLGIGTPAAHGISRESRSS